MRAERAGGDNASPAVVSPASPAVPRAQDVAWRAVGADDPRTRGSSGVPLCVDLDGTLIRTDLLIESFFGLLKRRPALLLLAPFWLLKGRAWFKHQIARRVELDVTLLPYHAPFFEYLAREREAGRPLCLVTASHEKYAHQVARHLGIFDRVFATDAAMNLSGRCKRARLCEAFGEHGFDYAGNSRSDLDIFAHAREAILVNPGPGVRHAAKRRATIARTFDDGMTGVKVYVKLLRLHQWLKNLLVFAPLVADHQVGNVGLLLQAAIAFFAFGLCASGVYLLNDLLDLDADRRHPRKRARPLAAGTFPIKTGALLVPGLLATAFAISLLLLPPAFTAVLGGYFVATLAYSFWLKGKLIVDVLVLAGLYTLRIIAGAAATGITPSFWLLALSMFLFLSLAMIKRYSELLALAKTGDAKLLGRNYQANDYMMLSSLGGASGYAAVMVLALYINSNEITLMYHYPMAIWLLCPILLYWISRMWALTGRGEMHDDPVVFALRDRNSRWLAVAGGAILLLAM